MNNAPFLGTTLKQLPEILGLSEKEIWGEEEPYLWFAKLYPVCDSIKAVGRAGKAVGRAGKAVGRAREAVRKAGKAVLKN